MKNVKAIIFDFDGVLVNTEYTTFCYYKEVLPSYGFHLKESDFRFKIGRKSVDFFKDVMKERFDTNLVNKLVKRKRESFQDDIEKYLKPVPGGFEFVKTAKKEKFLTALASQNEKVLIEKAVDVFKIRKYFDVILSIQDISHKKPHPELYLKAAEKLEIAPKEGIVVEDTLEGIEAASRGGFGVICITTSFSSKDLREADLVVDSFSEIDLLKTGQI